MACCARSSSWGGCASPFSWAPRRRGLRAFMTASAAEAVCRLMVFARGPQPGDAKTRLIPDIGKAGAADLHRRLVGHSPREDAVCPTDPVDLRVPPGTCV